MDLNKIVNAVQRSNITSEYRGLVVQAVIEYYKELERARVVKPKKVEPKVEEPKEVEEIVNEPIEEPVVEVKKKRKPRAKRSK